MTQTPDNPPAAIILAGGKGTRMSGAKAGQADKADAQPLPKVVYPVADRPMIQWVVRACREAGVGRCVVVVGYKSQMVAKALADEVSDGLVELVEQSDQLGTAHAARMAQPIFDAQPPTDVFVLAGDGPLIRASTLNRLLEVHRRDHAACSLATAMLDDPGGYGRVMRHDRGGFQAIVEEKDATPDQRRIGEVNPSYYCFNSSDLFPALGRIGNDNAKGEYYLTDVPALLQEEGKIVSVVDAVPAEDVLSINTPEQLEQVDSVLRDRLGGMGDMTPHQPLEPTNA